MPVVWKDLQSDLQIALRRLNRGPYPGLSDEVAARLVALGLAELRANGVGINRAGRELVINALLEARRD